MRRARALVSPLTNGLRRKALAIAALALVPVVLGLLVALAWISYTALAPGGRSASAAGSLACSVKASCGAGEVEVFRMSSTSKGRLFNPTQPETPSPSLTALPIILGRDP